MTKAKYMALADFQTLWTNKIKPTLVTLGETSDKAYRGDRGKTAYDHSQSTHARTDANNSTVAYDGTNKKLTKTINGTTTDVVTALQAVADGMGLQLNPVNLIALSADYTFKKYDAMVIDGIIYLCTADTTTKPPFNFVFDDTTGAIVYETLNGVEVFTVDSDTLNTGWEALMDIRDRYYTEKRLTSKPDWQTTLAGYGIGDAYTKTQVDALTRHTRLTDFDLNVLKQAVADQNLEKYGLKVGDYKTINGHDYVIAGLNCMKGSIETYTVNVNHVGLIVLPHTKSAWNASGNTYTGADSRGGGYMNCDLHYYIKNTLLPLVQADLGSANLLAHTLLLGNSINQEAQNRMSMASGSENELGATDMWDEEEGYIAALSEMQVTGSTTWGSSPRDTGEADQELDVFRHYRHTEIFGDETVWLRDVAKADSAVVAYSRGYIRNRSASVTDNVAALVLFH